MMNWLVKWGVRRWILGMVNNALEAKAKSVEKARTVVRKGVESVNAIGSFLLSLDAKLADGKLTEDELDEAETEVAALVDRVIATAK